ncbi:DNA recombination protein RmuC [Aestuariibacter sp. P117]|uniref:DNA recombination protein RmuC n=2 Tax=Glaciecola petra TaxID=3075602 RepID=A0ABU2ZQT6_9ALTE|nr:DNA recombination protein RmuC [Aestuariibacter sp. P117]MDT0594398.1 DNA recombination protein RmuC [Aestuariibacter sp. P117]
MACLLVLVPIIVLLFARMNHQNKMKLSESLFLDNQKSLENGLALKQQEIEQLQTQHKAYVAESQRVQLSLQSGLQELQNTLNEQQGKIGELTQQKQQLLELKQAHIDLQQHFENKTSELADLNAKYESQRAAMAEERKAYDEKLDILKNAEKALSSNFEILANKIFEQKAEKFTKSSETGLNHLLSPLKSQIDDFKKQISDQYVKEGQERAALKTEILSLKELNQQITQEAAALTNALKGDNKQQGNWGEVVLAKVLDESGLREGHEYQVQMHLKNEEGKNYRPDVVVHLPNQKDIVIDSKVSLVAHEKYVNSEDEVDKQKAIKEHVNSIKGHIKGLSKKDYQELDGVQTLDYVLMFIPIESAFSNAIEADPELVKLAMDNQIMLVSPTNLLVALRTINNIWQYEYQNQHAKTIAEKAANMYNKFANFVEDMERIGRQIDSLGSHYDGAMNKLSRGKGNLIRQAESFKSLGVTPKKSISKDLLGEEESDSTETLVSETKGAIAEKPE